MVPLLYDPLRPWKEAAFSQYPRGKVMGYSLRSGQWRYTEWRTKADGAIVARELYDHSRGDAARANLVDRPEHADLVKRLEATMEAGWRGARPDR